VWRTVSRMANGTSTPEWMIAALRQWADGWRVNDLSDRTTVRFSSRMTRSFGRALYPQCQITIAARLLGGDQQLLREVLCHEFAHVSAHHLHGPAIPPHGAQWQLLVGQAGFVPRVTLPADPASAPYRPCARHYLHRCARCGAARRAVRPMHEWRCVSCVRAGRSGFIQIVRLPEDQLD
jgi:predicted SprT family Zn-dependent metalloprotease